MYNMMDLKRLGVSELNSIINLKNVINVYIEATQKEPILRKCSHLNFSVPLYQNMDQKRTPAVAHSEEPFRYIFKHIRYH